MGDGNLDIDTCLVVSNQGPGIDASDNARVTIRHSTVSDNAGGLWLWDSACSEVNTSTVAGGSTYALLLDGDSGVALKGANRLETDSIYTSSTQTAKKIREALQENRFQSQTASSAPLPAHAASLDSQRQAADRSRSATARTNPVMLPSETGVFMYQPKMY